MKPILAATDGSSGADRAVAAAAQFAKLVNCGLLIVTVTENHLSEKQAIEISRLGMTVGDALEEYTRQILAKAKLKAEECGAKTVKTTLSIGDPASAIIELACHEQADAIGLGGEGAGASKVCCSAAFRRNWHAMLRASSLSFRNSVKIVTSKTLISNGRRYRQEGVRAAIFAAGGRRESRSGVRSIAVLDFHPRLQ